MKIKYHLQLLVYASFAWVLFYVIGLPEYYLQYSTKILIGFDLFLLIPFTLLMFKVLKPVNKNKRIKISLWYSFYFTIPLAFYDYLYCGIYLGYGLKFIYVYWVISVYYIIFWILFPLIAIGLNKSKVV